ADGRVAHAEEMRDRFYVYDGTKLVLRAKSMVFPYIEPVVQRLYAEAKVAEIQRDEKTEHLKAIQGNATPATVQALRDEIAVLDAQAKLRRAGAARLESRDGIYAAVDLMKSARNVHVEMAQLDSHPTWLNVLNGTLDLDTGEFWEHR